MVDMVEGRRAWLESMLYQFDLNGFLVVEDALDPALLTELNAIADDYEARAGV